MITPAIRMEFTQKRKLFQVTLTWVSLDAILWHRKRTYDIIEFKEKTQ